MFHLIEPFSSSYPTEVDSSSEQVEHEGDSSVRNCNELGRHKITEVDSDLAGKVYTYIYLQVGIKE
jgi:hypothetical protein